MKRGRFKVYLTPKDHVRYNINKYFFQLKRGIIKFRGETPIELEGYKQYNNDEIKLNYDNKNKRNKRKD